MIIFNVEILPMVLSGLSTLKINYIFYLTTLKEAKLKLELVVRINYI